MHTLTLADPIASGPLTVFPLLAVTPPTLRYLSFAEAVGRGTTVKELPGGASVNDLYVVNPLDEPVLLYEGEEVLGAQQNRTFDVSALVAARSELRVPVSCVEHGRWDGRRHAEPFAPAPQAAYPALRRAKNEALRASVAAGGEARARQGEVWAEVAAKAARHGVASETDALHDVYEGRRDEIGALAGEVTCVDGQVGALAAIGGRFVVLDHVSRPAAWAALHGPIVQGYALDALESDLALAAPTAADAQDFLDLLLRAPLDGGPAVGLGEAVRFAFGGLAGSGVAVEGELVALTAFAA
jgi:ARG/rhodanese/phosphatase superfamily protein